MDIINEMEKKKFYVIDLHKLLRFSHSAAALFSDYYFKLNVIEKELFLFDFQQIPAKSSRSIDRK